MFMLKEQTEQTAYSNIPENFSYVKAKNLKNEICINPVHKLTVVLLSSNPRRDEII